MCSSPTSFWRPVQTLLHLRPFSTPCSSAIARLAVASTAGPCASAPASSCSYRAPYAQQPPPPLPPLLLHRGRAAVARLRACTRASAVQRRCLRLPCCPCTASPRRKKWIDANTDASAPDWPDIKQRLSGFFAQMDRTDNLLQDMLQRACQRREEARHIEPTPTAKLERGVETRLRLGKAKLIYSDCYDLACQLALADADLFRRLRTVELRKLAWTKPDRQKRTPTILAFIYHFNRVAIWVASSIIKETRLKKRVRMLGLMVSLASCLRLMGDFHGAMSVLAGLSMASVKRLRWTHRLMPRRRQQVRQRGDAACGDTHALCACSLLIATTVAMRQRLEALETELNSSKSYHAYRLALESEGQRGPVIPFLFVRERGRRAIHERIARSRNAACSGVVLSDLVFIEEGNPDMLEEGQINFAKQYLTYNVIMTIERYQRRADYSHLARVQARYPLMAAIETASETTQAEDALYEMSLQIEPRQAGRNDVRN